MMAKIWRNRKRVFRAMLAAHILDEGVPVPSRVLSRDQAIGAGITDTDGENPRYL
jgi:hypothetical protein